MPLIWKPQPNGVYESWIKCIDEQRPILNPWELQFIASIRGCLRIKGWTPSKAQADKLESIYADKTK